MPVSPHSSRILMATLVLSVLAHGVLLAALALGWRPEKPAMRVVAGVEVVNRLDVPKVEPVPQKRPKVVLPEPVKRPDLRPQDPGTRPGRGGDPAPAPLALKLDLPKTAPQARVPSRMHTDRSVDGAPDAARPFGDPNGVRGGVGEGGNGPGGTGGTGEGGAGRGPGPAAPSGDPPLRSPAYGSIYCIGCHDSSAQLRGRGEKSTARPINIEFLSQASGWDIRADGRPPQGGVRVRFEYQVDGDGKVEAVEVLQTSPDPEEAKALEEFARMHEFTPPGFYATIKIDYLYFPAGFSTRR